MKKSYSVQAWEDKDHMPQFYIKNIDEFETARVIYNALCCDSRWSIVVMFMDVIYDRSSAESALIAEFERS